LNLRGKSFAQAKQKSGTYEREFYGERYSLETLVTELFRELRQTLKDGFELFWEIFGDFQDCTGIGFFL